LTAPKLAKEAAKTAAKELGAAASDEARELSMAATRKVMELGERRRERRAEKHHATEAAMRLAEEHGIDIDTIEGTGADGRIVVKDVKQAAAEE
jgi:pyruvate/2-oxoglutarate dehydrogenase complex dihydrolipoamide acyltransferase (E2) component